MTIEILNWLKKNPEYFMKCGYFRSSQLYTINLEKWPYPDTSTIHLNQPEELTCEVLDKLKEELDRHH